MRNTFTLFIILEKSVERGFIVQDIGFTVLSQVFLLLQNLHSLHPCRSKNLSFAYMEVGEGARAGRGSFTHRLSGYFLEMLWNQEIVLETVSN
jgi:hypothetical protein